MTVTVRAPTIHSILFKTFYNHVVILLKFLAVRWIAIWTLVGLMMVIMHPARADEPVELGDITIEAATATPDAKGGRSKVRFQIINNSRTDLHLIAISTPVADKAELIARVGDSAAACMYVRVNARGVRAWHAPVHASCSRSTSVVRSPMKNRTRSF